MLEKSQKQISNRQFIKHLIRNFIFGLIFIIIALFIGMCGYHYYEKMSWVDSFINASMILSGMGPVTTLYTIEGKIFAGLYALFSGLAFIAIVALIFAPIIRKFFRKIHLELL
ncbi:MAG TPA: hypothetical protein PKD00_07915 [Burkholderiales bacterium]|nr:hypothetical protein [Burkholderiales bacterium]